MLFNSFSFLFAFLPLSLFVYIAIPVTKVRNVILFLISIIFYCWNDYKLIFYIFAEALFVYVISLIVSKTKGIIRKIIFVLALTVVVGVLVYYKYTDYLLGLMGLEIELSERTMPVGLSFYSFNLISYVADVYKEKTEAEKNPFYVLLYVVFFPFVLSGPLQRYDCIRQQFKKREFKIVNISNGLRRFVIGLGKKVILANNLAIIADHIFKEMAYSDYTSSICWLGAICYAMELFFDFSGYSDMAIGLANAFGFASAENFNYPYMANSITDFWRRWHISLSAWFKDYIYIPLGGNKVGKIRQFINILAVWILTGLWHGASTNYVIWGLYFGGILIIEKLLLSKILKKAYVIRNIYCILTVLVGWVIFNTSSFEQANIYLSAMFGSIPVINLDLLESLGYLYLIPYVVVGFLFCINIPKKIYDFCNQNVILGIITDALLVCVFCHCIVLMINASYSPFLYFQY